MKNSFKILGSMFALLLMFNITAKAASFSDKMLDKARTAIENSNGEDWEVRASWAKKCIARGINTEEVSKWLDKSLSIQENAYNLEVKGDYYAENKMPEKAIASYIKSISAKLKGSDKYDIASVQAKIAQLK